MFTHEELSDIMLYLMTHRIPNAKLMFNGHMTGVMFNWDQDAFDHDVGFTFYTYEQAMPVLEILAQHHVLYKAYHKAIGYGL